MASINKEKKTKDANSNNNKPSLLPTTNRSKVTKASSSAKPKKGDTVMVTNETLPGKTKKKSPSVSKKTPSIETTTLTSKNQSTATVSDGPTTLKKQATYASNITTSEKLAILESPTSLTAALNDQAISTSTTTLNAATSITLSNKGAGLENPDKENSDPANLPPQPKLAATQKSAELSEVDANIISTANSKNKAAVSKRTRTEMEDNSTDAVTKAFVAQKRSVPSVATSVTSAKFNKVDNTFKNSKAKNKLTTKDLANLFEESTNGAGLQAIEISTANLESQLFFNNQIATELENSLPNSNLGITLVWESKEHSIRFFAPFGVLVQQELTNMSEVEKVLATNPTTKQSEPDTLAKLSKMKPFGFYKIMQLHDKIEELFSKDQKSFQTVGKGSKFYSGDYFIRNSTGKHIKVLPCALHRIISLTCVLTLLQTKAIEFGTLKMRPIYMAAVNPEEAQITNRLSTVDGYYFAEDCYSMNISEEMCNKYIQLCKI